MRIAKGSRDVGHVPPPDPEYFWPFAPGQTITLGYFPFGAATFRVDKIHDTWVSGTQQLGDRRVTGELDLDHPMIIVQTAAGNPLITVTLREVRDGKAFLQVTVRSDINAVPRAGLEQ